MSIHSDHKPAMTQSLMHSRLSSGFLHLQPERGFVTLQTQRRHAKILNGDQEFSFRVVSCDKNLDLTKNFSSSCEKPKTRRNLQTVGATSDGEAIIQPRDETWQSTLQRKWDAFWLFSRPYSTMCTILGVSSVSLLPFTSVGDFSPAYFVGLLQALIPFAFGNIFTSGVNQLTDVEIDKINKPFFPLITGELSTGEGNAIVSALAFMGLAIIIMSNSVPLFVGVFAYYLIGAAYSVPLPLLRWKTNPHMAAFSMAGLMGLTIQPAVFFHIQNALGKPMVFSRSVAFATFFFSVFSAVLGAIKDMPDVEGDRAFGNLTYTVRYGPEKVFNFCLNVLMIAYGAAVVIGASSPFLLCKTVSVIGHTTLASLLMLRAKSTKVDDPESTQSFYMFLFKLLYAEYVLIHFMR